MRSSISIYIRYAPIQSGIPFEKYQQYVKINEIPNFFACFHIDCKMFVKIILFCFIESLCIFDLIYSPSVWISIVHQFIDRYRFDDGILKNNAITFIQIEINFREWKRSASSVNIDYDSYFDICTMIIARM